jgi:hypothetical protein
MTDRHEAVKLRKANLGVLAQEIIITARTYECQRNVLTVI